MTDEDVHNLAKWLAVQVTEASLMARQGDDIAELEALETTLTVLFDFISKVDSHADASILTRSLGEMANIKFGAKAQFIKSYADLENRPATPTSQMRRAILVVAQELLQESGMTLADARSHIAERTDYKPDQLAEHRKRIKSNSVNTANIDEKETYQQFKENTQGKPPKQAADALIILANNL